MIFTTARKLISGASLPKNRFGELINQQESAQPVRPLVHSTDVYRFRNALDENALNPRPCAVFDGEPLIYFFYGRPSYRVNSTQDAASLDHYLPVCLLFRAGSVAPIKRIFPFDSGGFAKDLYADAMHIDMRLADFLLEPDPQTPGKVISLFFDTVDDYLRAHAKREIIVDATELEAKSFHSLISNRLSNAADNRVAGIEVQFEGPISLSDNVDAVILPDTLASSDKLLSQLSAASIEPIIYTQIDRQRPSEYVTTIFTLCFEYYQRKALMSKI
jgi:hypothetical protein